MSTGRSRGPKSSAAISPPRLGSGIRRSRGSAQVGAVELDAASAVAFM
jgi:hypothetical protein